MENLVRAIKPREVVISVLGVREGLLYSLLKDNEKRRDPLIQAAADLNPEPIQKRLAYFQIIGPFRDANGVQRRQPFPFRDHHGKPHGFDPSHQGFMVQQMSIKTLFKAFFRHHA